MANTNWWNIEWYTKSDTEDLDSLGAVWLPCLNTSVQCLNTEH